MTATIDSFVDPDRAAESGARGGGSPAGSGDSLVEVASEFARYAAGARANVEEALDAWLMAKAAERAHLPEAARVPVEAAADLARRGGKRLRAVLVACAYEGLGGEGGIGTPSSSRASPWSSCRSTSSSTTTGWTATSYDAVARVSRR